MAFKPLSEPTRISQGGEPPVESLNGLTPGSLVGDFLILKEIGRGAFAQVYLVRQMSLNREAALKVSRTSSHEGRTLARLDHPNIVRVFSDEFRADLGVRFTAVQFIAGTNLEALLQRPPPAALGSGAWLGAVRGATDTEILADRASDSHLEKLDALQCLLWTGVRLCRALQHAHDQGVLHLDIKPANILVDKDGNPYLADFNVSGSDTLMSLGTPSNLGGTPTYMSPEQKRATDDPTPESVRAITTRSDVFSLGKVLRVLADHWKLADHEWVASEQGTCREIHWLRFNAVLEKALSPSAADRYASAAALAVDLESCLEFSLLRARLRSDWSGETLAVARRRSLLTFVGMGLAGTLFHSTGLSNLPLLPESRRWLVLISVVGFAPLIHLGFFLWLKGVFRDLKALEEQPLAGDELSSRGTALRKKLVLFPLAVATYVLLAWSLGAGTFSIRHVLPAQSLLKIFIMVIMVPVALLATSTAFAMTMRWILGFALPRLWARSPSPSQAAATDLKTLRAAVAYYQGLSVYVPLAMAGTVIWNNRLVFDMDTMTMSRLRIFEFFFLSGWQVKATESVTHRIDTAGAVVEELRAGI